MVLDSFAQGQLSQLPRELSISSRFRCCLLDRYVVYRAPYDEHDKINSGFLTLQFILWFGIGQTFVTLRVPLQCKEVLLANLALYPVKQKTTLSIWDI